MNDSTEEKHEGGSPKRMKLSTINYVHQTFFVEGQGSDIKILALNREWNLHQRFLSQSPYFKSMFSSLWIEETGAEVNLAIEDVNITAEALHKVLESLYFDEIQIEPAEAVPILACAAFLQLEDLINVCTEIMKACINKDTAVRFFEVAELYSIEEVKNVAFDWLCRNIWAILSDCFDFPQLFCTISEDLMNKLLTSSDLCVEDEGNVFAMLITWVYMKVNSSDFDANKYGYLWENLHCESLVYFTERYKKGKPFLETDSGLPYQSLSRAVRINNLLLDEPNSGNIEIDIFFPVEWCMSALKTQWYRVLRINKGVDEGPISASEEVFNRECVRISGLIPGKRQIKGHTWSYETFDFGFRLGFCYENGTFKIKRVIKSKNSVNPAFSRRGKQYLMYRVSLFSEDDDGRVLSKAETGIQTVLMAPNDKIEVLTFEPLNDSTFEYRINFLLSTP